MIKKLQTRFIRIAVISLTVAMVLVVGIVNVANWISVRRDLSDTLNLLAESEAFPVPDFRRENATASGTERNAAEEQQGEEKQQEEEEQPPRPFNPSRHVRNMVSESAWFSGLLNEKGESVSELLAFVTPELDDAVQSLLKTVSEHGYTILTEDLNKHGIP